MKTLLFIIIFLLCAGGASSDCSAPALSLPLHEGTIFGFMVTKVIDEPGEGNIDKARGTMIHFGDYSFLVSAVDTGKKPAKTPVDTSAISERLLQHFTKSPHYLSPEKQVFAVSGIEAFDLSGDSKEDLVLFNVSPGANVYSGAIGIIDGQWKILVEPTCY